MHRNLPMRAMRLAVVPLGVSILMMAGAARAGDDNRSFSEKFMDGLYGTIRGSNMDNRGIDYRERSPLVVPPTLDLPPPKASSGNAQVANWPKDPDEGQRRAVIAAKKKNAPPAARVQVSTDGTVVQGATPINIAPPVQTPQSPDTVRPAYASDRNGTALTDPVYDQAGDLFSNGSKVVSDTLNVGNLFGSKSDSVAIQPGTEPTREALTQPPIGYQVPSPNYAYGVEPKGLLSGTANPDRNPLSQASSASSVVH